MNPITQPQVSERLKNRIKQEIEHDKTVKWFKEENKKSRTEFTAWLTERK